MFGLPSSTQGFAGFAEFDFADSTSTSSFGGKKFRVRATSCDLKLGQEINKPNVYDIFYDRNVYNLKPEEIEGSVEYMPTFPRGIAVTGSSGASGVIPILDRTPLLFQRGIERDWYGRLTPFQLMLNHAPIGACFRYLDCYVNTLQYTVRHSDAIKIAATVYGMDREEEFFPAFSSGFPLNNRVLTWNDALVYLHIPDASFGGERVRSFTASINNNLERFYTGGGYLLKPQDITAKNREIEGTMTIMGRYQQLAQRSLSNSARCREYSMVEFGWGAVMDGAITSFRVKVPNCLFLIEEIALTNDIVESVIKWTAFPANNPVVVEGF